MCVISHSITVASSDNPLVSSNLQNKHTDCCINALNCKHAFIQYNLNLTYLYDYIKIHGGSHENYLVQLKTAWEIDRCTCIMQVSEHIYIYDLSYQWHITDSL